jgi:hypothetical protein
MSKLMSVAFTEQAVIERRKNVTRRAGWWEDKNGRRLLKPGDRLTLCRKVMGRKAGEPLVKLAEVRVWDVRRERLDDLVTGNTDYGDREMVAEGFPGLDPNEFIWRYFEHAQGINRSDEVTRIEWRYLDDEADQ